MPVVWRGNRDRVDLFVVKYSPKIGDAFCQARPIARTAFLDDRRQIVAAILPPGLLLAFERLQDRADPVRVHVADITDVHIFDRKVTPDVSLAATKSDDRHDETLVGSRHATGRWRLVLPVDWRLEETGRRNDGCSRGRLAQEVPARRLCCAGATR